MSHPIYIYVAVAEKDEEARNTFEQHLAGPINRDELRVFHHGKVRAGESKEALLDERLHQAHIIVLLRTVLFDNDDRCRRDEAWASRMFGTKVVIPVIVAAHHWNTTQAFSARLMVLPRNGQPIRSREAKDQDSAWTEVAKEIYEAAKRISTASYAAHPPAQSAPVHYQQPMMTAQPPPRMHTAGTQAPATKPATKGDYSTLRRFIALCVFGLCVYYYAITQTARDAKSNSTLPALPEAIFPSQCASPCCGGVDCALNADEMRKLCSDPSIPCCPSGRKCVPLACSQQLSPNQHYNLRLAHATVNGQEPSMDGQICFRRVGAGTPRQCVPYSSAHANSKNARATPPQTIPILLGDILAGKGLEVEIWEQSQPWPAAQFTITHDNIKATALCIGLKLAQAGNPNTRVLVFLDDP